MNRQGLNGNQLKLIAVVTMILDHIGYLIVGAGILPGLTEGSQAQAMWTLAYALLRCAGRMAFPIFCFMLVEGFFHTGDRKKYGLRLALFALISEIPFDLMSAGKLPYWASQNVFVTLTMGLLMLAVLEVIREHAQAGRRLIQQLLVILTFSGLAWFFRSDYDYIGIMLTAILYMLRFDRKQACLIGFLWMGMTAGVLYLIPGYAAAFWLLSRYNGERGKLTGTAADKYFFYLFYPVHILILVLVYRAIFG